MSAQNERLKEVRLAMGLNQTEMGKLMGVSFSSYAMIERGERNLRGKHLLNLESTNANVDYIKTGEGTPIKDRHAEEMAKLFAGLPEDKQKLIMDLMKTLLENQ